MPTAGKKNQRWSAWVKSAKQRYLWRKGARWSCSGNLRQIKQPPLTASKKRSKTSVLKSNIKAQTTKPISRSAPRSWLEADDADATLSGSCGIEKDVTSKVRRRKTGGVFTAVFPCGRLADWVEIWPGESVRIPCKKQFFTSYVCSLPWLAETFV